MARFRLATAELGSGDHELSARFLPEAGSHFQAGSATFVGGLAVVDCAVEECGDPVRTVAATDVDATVPVDDPTARWMALALAALVAGGLALWLLTGGPGRRPVRRP